MRAASLCAGIGGLDLILESFGHEIAWHAEYDIAPSKVLAHHWPGVPNIGDITTADWADCEPVDIITAGYPCQPFSAAGLRKGTDDDRHLWPFVRDAIAHLRPRYALLENVRGHLSLGFDTVLADLAAIGFDAEWGVLGSSDVGGCHGRKRLWVLAADAHRSGGEALIGRPGAGVAGRLQSVERGQSDGVALLPTPTARDHKGRNQRDDDTCLPGAVHLLPTPRTSDTNGAGAHGTGGMDLRTAIADIGVDDGIRLGYGATRETRSDEALRDLWGADGTQAFRGSPRGSVQVLGSQELFAGMREHEDRSDTRGVPAPSRETQEEGLRGLRGNGPTDDPSPRSQLEEQRAVESRDALSALSHDSSLAGGLGWRDSLPAWGKYAPAVERWAVTFGHPPPKPTDDQGRLNQRAVEWMMGYPAGWVTDLGLTRTAQLKALGNAVQPQAGAAAYAALARRAERLEAAA